MRPMKRFDVHLTESEELKEKINNVHNMEYSSDFVSQLMTDTVSKKVMSDPNFIYNRSLGRSIAPCNAVHRSLRKVPSNLIGMVHEDNSRGFNGHFSKSGNFFLASFQDRSLKVYLSSDPLQMRHLSTRAAEHVQWSVLDVAFSPDERTVAYSGWADRLYLMDIMDEDVPVRSMVMETDEQSLMCAFSIKFDSTGREIIAGGYEGTIYIGDVYTGQKLSYIENAHAMDINALDFADAGGHVFVSGGDDAILRIFDRRTLRTEKRADPVGIFVGHTCGITFLDSKGDSRYIISNSKDQTIRLWDMRRMGQPSEFNRTFEDLMKNPAFHWDYRYRGMPPQFSGRMVPSKSDVDHSLLVLRGHEVRQTLIRSRFSPALTTGQRFVYAGSSRGSWHLWDLLTGDSLAMIVDSSYHGTVIRDVSWHPSQPVVLTTDFDGSVKCFHHRSLLTDPLASDEEKRELSRELLADDVRLRPVYPRRRSPSLSSDSDSS